MGASCKGRVALVTGASRGIGQAIAVRLAAEGADVAVTGRPMEGRNTSLAGSLEETVDMATSVGGGRVHPILVDIADRDLDKASIVADIESTFSATPDVLVHVAAAPR